MQEKSLISVIVPVYNSVHYVTKCIESILAQTHENLEIILIDDGSVDGSGEICDEMAKKDLRITVVHQTNQGLSAARNIGLFHASGEYISFVDSDDLLPPEAMSHLFFACQNSSADLIVGDCHVLGSGSMGSYWRLENDEYSRVAYCIEMVEKTAGWLANVVWGKLFRHGIIKQNELKFRENVGTWEDSVFTLDYLAYAEKIINVKKPVYSYFRYDEAERLTLSTVLYFDVFRFYFRHAQNFWLMVWDSMPDSKQVPFCTNIIDQLIIYLVHAMVFEDYFAKGELTDALGDIIENDITKTLIKHYVRKNPSYSMLIPFFIKIRCRLGLCCALKHRALKYRKTRVLPTEVKSIFRSPW